MANTISFMSANYVARQVNYQMTGGWGQGDRATNEYFRPLDTGWYGAQAYDAAQAILELNDYLFHIYLKDVRQAGAHETCRYGEGIVPIETCVAMLKKIGYTGAISVEHEPELFDPSEDCRANLALLRTWLVEDKEHLQ